MGFSTSASVAKPNSVKVYSNFFLSLPVICFSFSLNASSDGAFFILTGISFPILYFIVRLKPIDFCVKLNSYLGRKTFPEVADLV